MRVSFACPACGQANRSDELTADRELVCSHCGWQRPASDELDPPAACTVCGNSDLWRQKDFPQSVGLLIVAAGAVLSSIAWYLHWPMTALGLLMAFALADMLVFAMMPDVLVCYRCKARHHSAKAGAGHPGFSHEVAERYRQEEIRTREAQRSRMA
jgi:DNA-directed RNA polymerase subunit RPC12/RpoP